MNKNIVDKIEYEIKTSKTKKVLLSNLSNISTILFEIKRQNIYLDLKKIPETTDESSIIVFLELSLSYNILEYFSKYYKTIFNKYFIKEKLKIYYLLELYYEEIKKRGKSILGLRVGDLLLPILEKIKKDLKTNELTLLINDYYNKDFIIKKNLELYFGYFSKIIIIDYKEEKILKKSH